MPKEDHDDRLDSLQNQVGELKTLLEGFIKGAKGQEGEEDTRVQRLREHLSRGEEWIKEALESVGGSKAVEDARRKVEERPLTSVLWAFVAGILVGVLMRR